MLCSFNLIVKDKFVSDFKLKNATTNKWTSLSDYKNAKGFIIIFTCNKKDMDKPCKHEKTHVAVRHVSGIRLVKCSGCGKIIS